MGLRLDPPGIEIPCRRVRTELTKRRGWIKAVIRHDALSSWVALRVGRDGVVARILKIETDLSVAASDMAYRKDKLKACSRRRVPI